MKKLVSLLVVVFLLMPSVAGMAELARTPAYEGERPTLTIGWDAAWFANSDPAWPPEILAKISDYLNIDLEFFVYESKDQLAMDIVAGDLPDIVEVPAEYVNQMLEAGMLVAMDDYLHLAPNLVEVSGLRETVMRDTFSNGTGNWYVWTPNVGTDCPLYSSPMMPGGYCVRWDVYKELGCPELKNDDDYIAFLKAACELHPTTEDGLPTYGFGAYFDDGMSMTNFAGIPYGYGGFCGQFMSYDIKNGGIVCSEYEEHGQIWEYIKLCNKAYRAGIFDMDCLTMSSTDADVKGSNGQYMGGHVQGSFNSIQRDKDLETTVGTVWIPVEGMTSWANMQNYIGPGFYYGITTNCENIEAAMVFFNFLNSEDGNRIMMTGGFQGEVWDYDENGVPFVLESAIADKASMTSEDQNRYYRTFWNCCSGISNCQPLSDGGIGALWSTTDMLAQNMTALDRDFCEHFGYSYPFEGLVKGVEAGTMYDASGIWYDAQSFVSGTEPDEIKMITTNCRQILLRNLPNVILAETDEAYEAARLATLAEMDAADVQVAIDWYLEAYDEAVAYITSALGE